MDAIKKLLIPFILFVFIGISNAQSNYIEGVWELAEMNHAGEVYPVNMHVVFNESGEIEMSGENVGTWSQNETENTCTISCNWLGGLEGENKILVLNDVELKLSNAIGDINSFKKISLPKDKELNNDIIGEWMFESAETNGKTNSVYKPVNFNKNGVFYIQDMVLGTWNYDQSDKTVMLDTKKVKGKHSILKQDNKHLVIKGEAGTLFFTKIDRDNILKENTESGLIGAWEFENKTNPEGRNFLIFKTPDEFVYFVTNRHQNDSGMWLFDKEGMILTMLGIRNENLPKGESKITKLDNDSLVLENNGKTYSLKKVVQDAKEIEHLSFSDKDFYEESGELKYHDEEQKLPWHALSIYGIQNTYAGIDEVVYNYKTRIENIDVFETKQLVAQPNVNLDEDKPHITFDYIFNGYDQHSIPEDHELTVVSYDQYSSPLFPLETTTYRHVGEEELVTPAGTFTCTVVEAIGEYEYLQKIWLINDLPGIFAKIIKEKTDENFGYYHVYELKSIATK